MTSTLDVAYYHYDYGLAGAGTYYNSYMWGSVSGSMLYALMKTSFSATTYGNSYYFRKFLKADGSVLLT